MRIELKEIRKYFGVVEIHGNVREVKCLSCDWHGPMGPTLDRVRAGETDPRCDVCGGILKSATISFGQQMPELPMQRAHEETMLCDLFIVLGSSLAVYPAAEFPRVAKRNGARLVIVNREPTAQDDIADLVIHAEIGPTLGAAVGVE